MTGPAVALYVACTDFLLACSHLAGMSYRDANALLFFIIWPALTLALLTIVVLQGCTLRRARRCR